VEPPTADRQIAIPANEMGSGFARMGAARAID